MKITIINDNPNSWIMPYAKKLANILKNKKHQVNFTNNYASLKKGDIAFLLSCEKILDSEILKLHKHNLVIHESALPKGRGWAPLTWQILENKNKIPITLFEAGKKVDSGKIYLKDYIKFQEHELNSELRHAQGQATIKLVLQFIDKYPNIIGVEQKGKPSYYPRRTPKHSELNINKSIKEQFNLLRVVDNKRYPAFFKYKNQTYILKIYKDD